MNIIQKKSSLWYSDMNLYYEKYPQAFEYFISLLKNDQSKLDFIAEGISQINDGKGFTIDNPLNEIGVGGFYGLIDMLLLKLVKRKTHYKFLKNGFIIDEFDIEKDSIGIFKIFNKISSKEYQ